MSKTNLRQSTSEYNVLKSHGYTLFTNVGEGSYSKVYLGEFKNLKKGAATALACKVIDTAKTSKTFTEKFLPRELRILAKLNHPHIIHVHSIFRRKEKYFIFMRHAEKGDLLHFIVKNGTINEKQARLWVRQIALALQYLHTKEIAHRDLKCENILVTKNFNVKVSDFGFSRVVVNKERRLEFSETFCGSLFYAAPEIIKGKPYSPKAADLWSFGVVIFIMLNKSYPFRDKGKKELYNSQINKSWKFRPKYAKKYSNDLKELVTALLEPDASKRLNIEQVISSEWITMDPTTKTMSPTEYKALSLALEERATISADFGSNESRRRTSSYLMSSKNSLTFYKHFQENDLAILRSRLNERRAY